MRVAAVIPHWNRSDLLSAVLESIANQDRRFDQVVVVDNGSTDDSAAVAKDAGVEFLELGRNLGFAAAVNHGIRHTQTDWVAILNNDVTLAASWLARMLEPVKPEVSFLTGKLLSAADPWTIDGTFDEVSRAGCAWRCGSGKPDGPLWNEAREIRIAPMTAGLFRRELFAQIGLLDESFGSYLEDVDFGLRCALAGKKGVYVPKAAAFHRGSATLGAWKSDTVRWIARNQMLLVSKHYGGQPRFPIVAGQLLWGFLALRHGSGGAWVRGKLDGWRAVGSLKAEKKPHPELGEVLRKSEQAIFELQRQTGFDLYWRVYFCLSRR